MAEIVVLDRLTPALRAAAAKISDFSRPLTLAGMVMQRSFVRQFAASGKPAWKPLAKSTVRRRRKRSSRPLQDTGTLRRSYTSRGAVGGIWNLGRFRLTIGSNLIYAATHQFGADISRVSGPGSAFLRRTRSGQYRFARRTARNASRLRRVGWAGGKSYTIHVPARPLAVQPEDAASIERVFTKHAQGAFGR